MPRFPVAFGRRKSTAETLDNAPVAEPSFRVMERSEVAGGKSPNGAVRSVTNTKPHALPRTRVADMHVEDNIFADFKSPRYVHHANPPPSQFVPPPPPVVSLFS